MTSQFDYFVIYAGMRTGSNFLESNINKFDGLKCYGEAFNPAFISHDKKKELFGTTLAQRDSDPMQFVEMLQQKTDGLAGFRLFRDHDPRVIEQTLSDPRCAKIILTRNLVEAWVSQRIAWSTNQWWLDDAKNAKKWKVSFDPEHFEAYYYASKTFHQQIAHSLQISGQTGFYVDYEDLQDLDVINGLARFLGRGQKLDSLAGKFKKQNPEMLAEKVRNFDLLEQTVNKIDRYDLGRLPNFEPKSHPAVPTYFATQKTPVLFMPVKSGPTAQICAWLAALDGVQPDSLIKGFNQKSLRQWKRRHRGHRSFTVIRHPVARLYSAFCTHILPTEGPDAFSEIRQSLISSYKVPLPEDPADPAFDSQAQRAAFLEFAKFIKGNLNRQTAVRIDRAWATQDATLQGFAQFVHPDHILREADLETGLTGLAHELGCEPPALAPTEPVAPFTLEDIYDDEIEAAVRAAYQRDYMLFGFGPWK